MVCASNCGIQSLQLRAQALSTAADLSLWQWDLMVKHHVTSARMPLVTIPLPQPHQIGNLSRLATERQGGRGLSCGSPVNLYFAWCRTMCAAYGKRSRWR